MFTLAKMKDMDSTLLTLNLLDEVHKFSSVEDVEQVKNALRIAASLHVNDFRRSPRSHHHKPPYIEHVLRVALRPVKYFHMTNIDTIISSLLHDTVEDHAQDFFYGAIMDESQARKELLSFYAETFSPCVAETVEAVTNPIAVDKNTNISKSEKRAIYIDNVKKSVSRNKSALMVKVSDFIDNAGSLYLTNKNVKEDKNTEHLLSKYTPLIPFYRDSVQENFSGEQCNLIIDRINRVEQSFEILK